MVAYRRPRNIKDEIVRSKVNRVNNDNKGMRKCGESRFLLLTMIQKE